MPVIHMEEIDQKFVRPTGILDERAGASGLFA
jgi:hypothetical protein